MMTSTPIYADPPVDELDEEVWDRVHVVHEAVEHNGSRSGTTEVLDQWIAWKMIPRSVVTFVIVMEDDHDQTDIQEYLQELSNHYVGEVDDVRFQMMKASPMSSWTLLPLGTSRGPGTLSDGLYIGRISDPDTLKVTDETTVSIRIYSLGMPFVLE